jgi:hypothetical protein
VIVTATMMLLALMMMTSSHFALVMTAPRASTTAFYAMWLPRDRRWSIRTLLVVLAPMLRPILTQLGELHSVSRDGSRRCESLCGCVCDERDDGRECEAHFRG